MGKIKGWKKQRNNKKFETWTNDKNDSIYLEIYKAPANKQYNLLSSVKVVNPITHNKIGQNFFNYKEALAFAMKYMRSHPNG